MEEIFGNCFALYQQSLLLQSNISGNRQLI